MERKNLSRRPEDAGVVFKGIYIDADPYLVMRKPMETEEKPVDAQIKPSGRIYPA